MDRRHAAEKQWGAGGKGGGPPGYHWGCMQLLRGQHSTRLQEQHAHRPPLRVVCNLQARHPPTVGGVQLPRG